MENERSEKDYSGDCCGGGSNQDTGASCDCGTPKTRSRRIRTLIFAIIMLAAVGVGAYSLIAKSSAVPCAGQNCGGSSKGNCCPK